MQPGLCGAWHSLYRHRKEVFNLRGQGKGNTIRTEKETDRNGFVRRAEQAPAAEELSSHAGGAGQTSPVVPHTRPLPSSTENIWISGHFAKGVVAFHQKPQCKRCPQASRQTGDAIPSSCVPSQHLNRIPTALLVKRCLFSPTFT